MKINTKQKVLLLFFLVVLSQLLVFYWESNSVNIFIRLSSIPSLISILLIISIVIKYRSNNLLRIILLYSILILLGIASFHFFRIFLTVELPK